MATNKKYDLEISQSADLWLAKVTRKVNSRKRVITKEQGGFKSETEAKEWADLALAELTSKQRSSNDSHLQKRKENEEIKRLRSERRAAKTEQDKLDALAAAETEAKTAELEGSSKDSDLEFLDDDELLD